MPVQNDGMQATPKARPQIMFFSGLLRRRDALTTGNGQTYSAVTFQGVHYASDATAAG